MSNKPASSEPQHIVGDAGGEDYWTTKATGAASSDPQEWTPEFVKQLLRVSWDAKWWCTIASAHNAALRAHGQQVWDQRTRELEHDKQVALAAERSISSGK
jgi:hypothetical protein